MMSILLGLFVGAATILVVVITALILKEEFGWFEKKDENSRD